MAFSLKDWLNSVKEGLFGFLTSWRGALSLTVAVILIAAVVWLGVSYFGGEAFKADTNTKIAVIIVVLFAIYGFGLLVTFFWLFRGIKTEEVKLTGIINYCYAFIVFSLLASILPFVALPLVPNLDKIMMKSPIGIAAGCSLPINLTGEENTVPKDCAAGSTATSG
ncbi:MAG: hypothetical protein M3495_02090 [Pseudomonadota bacterium]|nr:hypothetical protein [Pseudomonadota bacterium]